MTQLSDTSLSLMTMLELRKDRVLVGSRLRPLSTLAFDWLYVLLSLLLTVGVMLDVFSHLEYGPDQSLFNEYHLLFYSSVGALLMLLSGLVYQNVSNGYPLAMALPHGYGIGMLAVLLFAVAGVLDLTGHALFGFESGVEALTSPSHLLLFSTWFLILFAPVQAARVRSALKKEPFTRLKSLPMLLAYGCMIACLHIPLMVYFQLGGPDPTVLQSFRVLDDYNSLRIVISGMFLQTAVLISFALWLAREFRLRFGSYTVVFGFYGLFLMLLQSWQWPLLIFAGFGLLLDIVYGWLRPDGTRQARFILFAMLGALALWVAGFGTFALIEGGTNVFYFSGYNFYGSIAQAAALAGLVGYLLSSAVRPEVDHA